LGAHRTSKFFPVFAQKPFGFLPLTALPCIDLDFFCPVSDFAYTGMILVIESLSFYTFKITNPQGVKSLGSSRLHRTISMKGTSTRFLSAGLKIALWH
jgi:hypothetical protein